MPYRNMTLAELARHIGMDARELQRLARKGVLPGRLIGGQWRFNRFQMLDWLQREMTNLEERHIRNLDRAMSRSDTETIIADRLATEGVDMNLAARSRPSVLRELVRLAERTGLVYDADELLRAIEDRESLASTALPGGIAFPHPRRPLPYATAESLICLARVPHGVPFGGPDRRLTDLFVFLCCHDEREHLLALARLALLFNGTLAEELREVASDAEAVELMITTERALLAKRK